MAKIAFLGTGTMGLPMARNLLRAGQDIHAWNRTAERAQPLTENGADVARTPAEAARGADILITMLSDSDAVLESAREALEVLDDKALWLQMSTIGLAGTDRCAELAAEAGVTLVDAPVLGTREPAEQRKLVILASGPSEARERCQPIFEALGHRVLWLGEAGQGTRCKVMINSWVVGVVGVLAETITLAEALKVDPQCFFEDPAFRLSLARKDSELILDAAKLAQLEVPILEAVTERLRRADSDGHGEEDMAATYWATVPELAGSRPG
jgi:3-hydroxyisobutyrate dehydrogenase